MGYKEMLVSMFFSFSQMISEAIIFKIIKKRTVLWRVRVFPMKFTLFIKDYFTQIFGMKYYRNLGRKDHMGERVVSKNYLEKVLHNCGLVKLFSVSHFSETFFFFLIKIG